MASKTKQHRAPRARATSPIAAAKARIDGLYFDRDELNRLSSLLDVARGFAADLAQLQTHADGVTTNERVNAGTAVERFFDHHLSGDNIDRAAVAINLAQRFRDAAQRLREPTPDVIGAFF